MTNATHDDHEHDQPAGLGCNEGLGLAPERSDDWSAKRPASGGLWLWREAAYREPVALRLTDDGSEVAPPDSHDCEGTPQYYWEQTRTDKAHMPGLWKRA